MEQLLQQIESIKAEITAAVITSQDELEQFIERQNDKDWWKKIRDELNNRHVKLSKADLELIQRVR